MKAVIVDDAGKARTLLRLMLAELVPDIQVVGEAENAEDAWDLLLKVRPDMLFLDIEMPGKSGLQLAEQLKTSDFKGKIIFITAYNAHALRAFRLAAVDYLLKPLQEQHLLEAIQKVREIKTESPNAQLEVLKHNLEHATQAKIAVPIVGGTDYLPLTDIVCFEADGAYVKIHLQSPETKVYSKNLKYFEQALSEHPGFVRTHRSFIVNKTHVKTLHKGEQATLVMTDNRAIPVSRERKSFVYASMHHI